MDSIHNKFKSGNIVEVQHATITRVEYGQICELQAENEELKRALELKHPVLDHMEQDINKIKADAIREVKECMLLSHSGGSDDFNAGFDQAVELYEEHLSKYANKLEDKQ